MDLPAQNRLISKRFFYIHSPLCSARFPTNGRVHRLSYARLPRHGPGLAAESRARPPKAKRPLSSQQQRNGEMPMQKLIPLDSRRRKSFRTRLHALRAGLTTLARDRRGEGYLDMAMKILIVVVIGAAILAIMNTAMPNLFQSLIDKITGELNNVTVLP